MNKIDKNIRLSILQFMGTKAKELSKVPTELAVSALAKQLNHETATPADARKVFSGFARSKKGVPERPWSAFAMPTYMITVAEIQYREFQKHEKFTELVKQIDYRKPGMATEAYLAAEKFGYNLATEWISNQKQIFDSSAGDFNSLMRMTWKGNLEGVKMLIEKGGFEAKNLFFASLITRNDAIRSLLKVDLKKLRAEGKLHIDGVEDKQWRRLLKNSIKDGDLGVVKTILSGKDLKLTIDQIILEAAIESARPEHLELLLRDNRSVDPSTISNGILKEVKKHLVQGRGRLGDVGRVLVGHGVDFDLV